MRPIDSDKFLQDMADLYRQAGWDEREVHFSLADLRSNIGTEDTIMIPQREPDTVPVRHGKWLYGESESGQDGYYCSHCMGHVRWYGKAGGQSIDFISDYHYCPNCGARMDEDDG